MVEPRAGAAGAVVIGLGNPLMGDDGLGLAALARLRDRWCVPDGVELVDGGTWGMNLLPVIEDAGAVVFLDAIDAGRLPGSVIVLERDDLPRFLALKISPHQVDLREVLAVAELRGRLPAQTVAIGLQPWRVAASTDLSHVVAEHLDALVGVAVERLASWGHGCTPRAPAYA